MTWGHYHEPQLCDILFCYKDNKTTDVDDMNPVIKF